MRFFVVLIAILLSTPMAMADALYGNCFEAKGAKCAKERRITTDFGDAKAAIDPEKGTYQIDLPETDGRTVTVFCDGRRVGALRVDGRTMFVVKCEPVK